jgi:hypothetical protein
MVVNAIHKNNETSCNSEDALITFTLLPLLFVCAYDEGKTFIDSIKAK